jgi:hypothetical protein
MRNYGTRERKCAAERGKFSGTLLTASAVTTLKMRDVSGRAQELQTFP